MTTDPLAQAFARVLKLPVEAMNDAVTPGNTSTWDSLAAMELVAEIEGVFGVQLTTREIMKMRSLGLARETLRAKGVAGV
jgi:acyl carrier protein